MISVVIHPTFNEVNILATNKNSKYCYGIKLSQEEQRHECDTGIRPNKIRL